MISPQNVLFVHAHDLGRELSCYGSGFRTPVLDHLAREGVRFDRAFCSSAACSPSRGCLMTGLPAHVSGLIGLANFGWSLRPEVETVVDHFNRAGFVTANFGIQHERAARSANRYQVLGRDSGYAEEVVAETVDWLRERAGSGDSRPFYLNVGLNEPHASVWQSRWAKRRNHRVEKTYRAVPENEAHVPPFLPDLPPLRTELARMQSAVEYMDAQLERLFAAIDALGLRENTTVIFTTDHGLSGERAKATLYDAGTEIALMIRAPGSPLNGLVVDHLVPNIDLASTVLEAGGVAVPDGMASRSLWPLLQGRSYEPHDAIFTERNYHGATNDYDPIRAVRTERWHYLRNFDPTRRRVFRPDEITRLAGSYSNWINELWPVGPDPRSEEELYDVEVDPLERVDRAHDPECAAVLRELRYRLEDWMEESCDPLLAGAMPPPVPVDVK